MQRTPWLWLMAVLFPAFLIGTAGYLWKGEPGLVGAAPPPGASAQAAAAAEASQAAGMDPTQFGVLADKLRERLKNEPDNAEGWSMLARAYLMLERPADAVPAFERAAQLNPKDAGLVADHAVALGLRNGRSLRGEAAAKIAQALAIDPQNARALSLAGSLAFEEGRAEQAIAQWTRALAHAPAEGEFAQQLRGSIEQAKAGLATAAAATPATVRGQASLAPALAAQVTPNDTVFIVARAAEGPRVPLAVLRKRVQDLPLAFTLDDSLAMSPQHTLSTSTAPIVVSVRVSKSGNAMPQDGDFEGVSAPLRPNSEVVQIVVSERITKP
jgi:cytochrome c-type biogenesis protein CcmH